MPIPYTNPSTPIPEILRDLRVTVLRRRNVNDIDGINEKPKASVGCIEDGVVSNPPLAKLWRNLKRSKHRNLPENQEQKLDRV